MLTHAVSEIINTYDLEVISSAIFVAQRRCSLLFMMQTRMMPMMSAVMPTDSSTGPATFNGFSPIDVLPGQCAISVIVTPMKIMPIAKTCTKT